jgi:hypothetical protein
MLSLQRYPRHFSPHPSIYRSLFGNCQIEKHYPVALTLTASASEKNIFFLQFARIALMAGGNASDLVNACYAYLEINGDSEKFLETCRKYLQIEIRIQEEVPVAKRTTMTRRNEFERRLDAYYNPSSIDLHIINMVKTELANKGYVYENVRKYHLLSDGRRENTDMSQMIEAVNAIDNKTIRAQCRANMENLAIVIWQWHYPKMTPEMRHKIMENFDELQNELKIKYGDPNAGCPNATIRLLYHFQRVDFPFSPKMFKIPSGSDTWNKNLAKLKI